uniref:hypothetical protein n=1 Tax=Gemmiger qucibialis TaxID=2997294 RepID=UPI003FED7F96
CLNNFYFKILSSFWGSLQWPFGFYFLPFLLCGILDHHGRAGWRAAGAMVGVALVGMVIRAAGA